MDTRDHPTVENVIIVPIIKKMEIIISIQVCFILGMNFDYEENGAKKFANPKRQDHASQSGEHDYSTNNKNNGDYYEYTSLLHFTNDL